MSSFYSMLGEVGYIIFGGYFLWNGIKHVFLKTENYVAYMKMKGISANAHLWVYVSGTLLILGGLGVATQMYSELALWCLVLFLIPTTVVMHAFWKVQDPNMKAMEAVQFGKNLALLGAVLSMMY